MNLNSMFYYDETSPSCLRWKVDRFTCSHRQRIIAAKDSVAGSLRNGYWCVKILYKSYRVHRIILQMLGHDLTNKVVDHVDGNSSDNRINNLRVCTHKINAQNKKKKQTNSSGKTGVKWDFKKSRCGTYATTYATAFWMGLDGKQKHKNFRVDTYGLLPAFKLALLYRIKMVEIMNSNGASYTARHCA